MLLYLGYVVSNGGDFMAGRFLAILVIISLLIITDAPITSLGRRTDDLGLAGAAALGVLIVGLLLVISERPPTSVNPSTSPRWDMAASGGISDVRGWYLQYGRGLNQWLMSLGTAQSPYSYKAAQEANPMAGLPELSVAVASWPHADQQRPLILPSSVGRTCWLGAAGLTTGPQTHWIDICGLSDRLLAGIPSHGRNFEWRIGHFERPVPAGYDQAIATGDIRFIEDTALRFQVAHLWERIRN